MAAAVAVLPKLRRVYICLLFIGTVKIIDVNFVSREVYRGWVRGFEIGSLDMITAGILASIFLSGGKIRIRPIPPIFPAIIFYVFVAMISSASAFVPLYAAFGLMKFVRYAITFWAVANAVKDEDDVRWISWTLVACVAYEVFVAMQGYVSGIYRARGTFDHSNTLGMYLNMLLPVIFSCLLNLKTKGTYLLLAIFGAGAGTVVLTLSRGSWVAMGMAIAIVLPISFILRVRPQKIAIVSIMTILSIPPGVVAVQKMIKRIQEAPESSGEARVAFNEVAREMAHNHLFGVGVNNYSYGTDGPYSAPFGDGLDKGGLCHNLYFLTTGEMGWIGLAALISILLSTYYHLLKFLLRHRDEGMRTIFVLGWLGGLATLTFQSTLEWAPVQTSLAMMFYGLLGVTSAITRMPAGKAVARWRITIRPGPEPQRG